MFFPSPDARIAEQFEDQAARLDAGLGLDAARPGEPAVAAMRRQWQLRDWEWAALTAAETAGALPRVLRRLATARQERAALTREIHGALAYPGLVLTLCIVVAGLLVATGAAPRAWIVLSVVLLAGLGLVATWLVRRLRDPGLDGDRLPLVGRLSRDAGELPYLVALQALYGAGVPLRAAHPAAAAAAAVPWVKARLFLATGDLEAGEPLASALTHRGALTPESLTLVRDGEATGQLEDALGRAHARRRDAYGRALRKGARLLGVLAYLYAAGSVLWIALEFYGGYFARLR